MGKSLFCQLLQTWTKSHKTPILISQGLESSYISLICLLGEDVSLQCLHLLVILHMPRPNIRFTDLFYGLLDRRKC